MFYSSDFAAVKFSISRWLKYSYDPLITLYTAVLHSPCYTVTMLQSAAEVSNVFARQRRSGSNLQRENGSCSSVNLMQRECTAAFTWRVMDFSAAEGWGDRTGPNTVHLVNLVALQHNQRGEENTKAQG